MRDGGAKEARKRNLAGYEIVVEFDRRPSPGRRHSSKRKRSEVLPHPRSLHITPSLQTVLAIMI